MILHVQIKEALVQCPPFSGSLPLPLILVMKKKVIPLVWHAPWQLDVKLFTLLFMVSV